MEKTYKINDFQDDVIHDANDLKFHLNLSGVHATNP